MRALLREHDACGVGFVARLDGPRHEVLGAALRAVARMSHRGAVSADGKSGDGAGVLTQLPYRLLRRDLRLEGIPDQDLAVGMLFLPPRGTDAARAAVEAAASAEGLAVLGWRAVPVEPEALGEHARATQPVIEQVVLGRGTHGDAAFARALYLCRRGIERRWREAGVDGYVVSLSHRTLVYKGLFVSPQLPRFYPDLTDPCYETALAVFHQRYSTNTFPSWRLAQPFRYLAHNGEINTLQGNVLWTRAREATLRTAPPWRERWADLVPLLTDGASDSAHLDGVLELLVLSGLGLLRALAMLVPQAWELVEDLDPHLRAFYAYHACLTEPWDGPAALAVSDGALVAGALDRNGLRPARYTVTADGLVVLASEAGVLEVEPERVLEKGRLGPGQVLAVDTARGRVLHDDAVKGALAREHPYLRWIAPLGRLPEPRACGPAPAPSQRLRRLQRLFGYTVEDVEWVLRPMATEGKDPVFSMGDDTPPAVLAQRPRLLYAYFRQRFAQVTNPPIDPLRERSVMALATLLGPRGGWLGDGPREGLMALDSPLLEPAQLAWLRREAPCGVASLEACFRPAAQPLGAALDDLCAAAVRAVTAGAGILVVSDAAVDAERVPIPMLLAVAAVHHRLVDAGLRMRTSLVAETGEARDIHQIAALLGYGTQAVCPYLAFATVASVPDGAAAYRRAVEAGLLKIMAKMGISTMLGYQGAQVFEAVGVDPALVERYFPGTPARLGGLGLDDLAAETVARHAQAFAPGGEALEDVGLVRFRRTGEYHAFNPYVVKRLHQAARTGDRAAFAAFSRLVDGRPPAALRDLLAFVERPPVPLEEVEPAEAIVRRFVTAAMSHGALSREAHEAIAIAANRIGARCNSGEGGEDPARYRPRPDGESANSTVKQIASARFGVTPAYVMSAAELEIKMAQGSKPGEGGQLPGHKVSAEIAAIRRAQPGITLISPPPHHDIYSIEDLAQLIYDLKRLHPEARVAVKLVAEAGVGTVAAGVAKGFADTVHISGHDGGTGASPLDSIKHAGVPWELGLAETQRLLVENGLRGRVRLRVDGGLKTGRDVVIAALLGADEFAFGSSVVVALGCVMTRECHLNTCPVGVATQREDLRRKFTGTPERVAAYLLGVAEEVRGHLAALGARTLDEVIGRVEWLRPAPRDHPRAARVDLRELLTPPAAPGPRRCVQPRNVRAEPAGLDDRLLARVWPRVQRGETVRAAYPIANTDRTVGARLAGRIAWELGEHALPEGQVRLTFRGSAGQSFGAFCVGGLQLVLEGEANDYVGKGMCGGEIVLRPPRRLRGASHTHVIAGNTVLYGATGGRLFAAGRAGERFAVRNSGAVAVVEGVGDHGCEYMTGGLVVVLGRVGRNFGAGMTGGWAVVLDETGTLARHCHPDVVVAEPAVDDLRAVRWLLYLHRVRTGSTRAAALLAGWPRWCRILRVVRPRGVAAARSAGTSMAAPAPLLEGQVAAP
ncbi:MAG: glutamate synthase large subunit [Armatimonadota bacterium]|nr:glutamate synthase large subunit [Armatimonadota bacterium]MDR7449618.1 glutamate synthase large subunit [Armatimonadota bacterium]MDR7460343.1 glutamate synthase large subunit [Armatimonadota bacterium]MDR7488077.1 glutamate synthase large subunit [Armatimonadota bacterium]MDR7492112.1 glutamate synthase large subunit [Armatimonadota bacterium]